MEILTKNSKFDLKIRPNIEIFGLISKFETAAIFWPKIEKKAFYVETYVIIISFILF